MTTAVLAAIIILLGCSVIAVAVFRRFKLPAILAFLFVGVVVGPHGLAWIPHDKDIHFLAELGIVFLLFTVGLDFSLSQLAAMKKAVLGLGGAQVTVTAFLIGVMAWLLSVSPAGAFVLGGVFAMSSTAIVAKQLSEQSELASRHGRLSLSILLFQDIAVVPFLILIPVLGAEVGTSLAWGLAWALLKGGLVVVFMIVLGYWLLRPLFHTIVSSGSSELFTLTALLFALAAAWVTNFSGLSLALGAFIAGVMLGETEFRYQLAVDIRPFRDVLLGLFFVTIGMMLNIHALPGILHWVLLLVVVVGVFKAFSVMALSRLFGAPKDVAICTGIMLSQGGEFGLVLLTLALSDGVLDAQSAQIGLATIIIGMSLTPVLVSYNGVIAKSLYSSRRLSDREEGDEEIGENAGHLSGHVIICGYGRVGQHLASLLEQEAVEYLALDDDLSRVQGGRATGKRVRYGDPTHGEILKFAGLERARIVIICYSDVDRGMKILAQIRAVCPNIPVLVRAWDESNLDRLRQAGATEVVSETLEVSLMLVLHALILLDMPAKQMIDRIRTL